MTELVHALRLASTVACGVVVIAFGLWATDETRAASDQQAAQVEWAGAEPAAAASTTSRSEPEHGGVRGVIEDANDALLSPFDHVSNSSDAWVQHAVPALLALLTYGLLARLVLSHLAARR